MALDFLMVDTYYPKFLAAFREAHPASASLSYDESLGLLLAQAFGTADFYSKNLRSLGHTATDIVANDDVLQSKWAAENGLRLKPSSLVKQLASKTRYVRRFAQDDRPQRILAEQIKRRRPEVLYFQNLMLCDPAFLRAVRPYAKLIVGQIASPLPAEKYLHGCDLILTSFPHYVERFRAIGVACEFFAIGFETTMLDRFGPSDRPYGAVFVGGVSRLHIHGNAILKEVARAVDLDVWGYGIETLPAASPLRRRFHGEAWGLDMYRVLDAAKIAINRHVEVAEGYANNMRLFEATGMGALMLTDEGKNLGDYFEVGREIDTYRDADDLKAKIRHYLANEDKREAVARAGQARTLRDHTYLKRMQELEGILGAYL